MKVAGRVILMAVLGGVVVLGGINLAVKEIVEERPLRMQPVNCVLAIGRTIPSEGLVTGYQWDLIHRMAASEDAQLTIKNVGSKYGTYIDSLKQGTWDLMILKAENADLPENDSIMTYTMLDSTIVWAVSKADEEKSQFISNWLDEFMASKEDTLMRKSYYGVLSPYRRANMGHKYETVCPYDSLLRKYAAEIKWDWKMIAAIIYKESRYDIGASSHRGAVGLMQMMPSTSKAFGVTEPLDPEQDIKAGVTYLGKLEKIFRRYAMDQQELYKFTLAAYNAGEGRIFDCVHYAESQGKLDGTWQAIVETIPDMREDSILDDENVKLGKFQGYETISYVEEVMTIYDMICQTTVL